VLGGPHSRTCRHRSLEHGSGLIVGRVERLEGLERGRRRVCARRHRRSGAGAIRRATVSRKLPTDRRPRAAARWNAAMAGAAADVACKWVVAAADIARKGAGQGQPTDRGKTGEGARRFGGRSLHAICMHSHSPRLVDQLSRRFRLRTVHLKEGTATLTAALRRSQGAKHVRGRRCPLGPCCEMRSRGNSTARRGAGAVRGCDFFEGPTVD
jgi:hypothetical protein